MESGFDYQYEQDICVFCTVHTEALRTTLLVQWVPKALSLEIMLRKDYGDISLPSSAAIKKAWSHSTAVNQTVMLQSI